MKLHYKIITPGMFTVMVTVRQSSAADSLVAGMCKRGYAVSCILYDSKLVLSSGEDGASTVVVFTVYTGNPDAKPIDVIKHLAEIIEEHQIHVYSSVVTEYCNAMFGGTNIKLPKKNVPPPLPNLSSNFKKMN